MSIIELSTINKNIEPLCVEGYICLPDFKKAIVGEYIVSPSLNIMIDTGSAMSYIFQNIIPDIYNSHNIPPEFCMRNSSCSVSNAFGEKVATNKYHKHYLCPIVTNMDIYIPIEFGVIEAKSWIGQKYDMILGMDFINKFESFEICYINGIQKCRFKFNDTHIATGVVIIRPQED